MPLLRIQLNCPLDSGQRERLATEMSAMAAQVLGKSENYVMVIVESDQQISFAGDCKTGAAYLELKSIALPEEQTTALSAALCQGIAERTAIDASRIYIEFSPVARHLWGWNGKTF